MIDPGRLFSSVPVGLRGPLVEEYRGIASAFGEGRWKLAGIDAGRFCEVVFTILDGALRGAFANSPSKPSHFPDACKALESLAPVAVGDRSLRILVPRMLPAIYEIRNNRNVGHVGGDVVSNKMDATYVRDATTWVMAELIRVFHSVSTAEAQESVDALVERSHPLVWERDDIKRVLDPKMSAPDRALVLLYSVPGWCEISKLRGWVGYGSNFASAVLGRLAKRILVEVDDAGARVTITPLGAKRVERDLL